MTSQQVLTLIGAIGIPTLVTVILNFLSNRQTLKRNAPKTDAEVDEINNRVQNQVITNLEREVTRLGGKADAAVKVAEAAEAKADGREALMRKALAEQKREFEAIIEDIQLRHEKEVGALREQIILLTKHIQDTEAGRRPPGDLPVVADLTKGKE